MVQKPGFWNWYLQRVTALILVVGLFVHFLALHFLIEKPINFSKVAGRLDNPWWISFDLILLAAALFHGLNGVYSVLLDVDPGENARTATRWVLWLAGTAAFLIGVSILNPFAAG